MCKNAARRDRSEFVLSLLVIPLSLFGQSALVENRGLVIEGGTLIDGTGRPPIRSAVIVIEGNRITAVGERGQVQSSQGAQVIPAAGKIHPAGVQRHTRSLGQLDAGIVSGSWGDLCSGSGFLFPLGSGAKGCPFGWPDAGTPTFYHRSLVEWPFALGWPGSSHQSSPRR